MMRLCGGLGCVALALWGSFIIGCEGGAQDDGQTDTPCASLETPTRAKAPPQATPTEEATELEGGPALTFVSPDPGVRFGAWGVSAHLYVSQTLGLSLQAEDAGGAPEDLAVTLYSDLDGKLAQVVPDESGLVEASLSGLSVGVHTLRAFAYDAEGLSTSAEFRLEVWDEHTGVSFEIAGYGPQGMSWETGFVVDDGVEFEVIDGLTGARRPCGVVDADGATFSAPVSCQARPGDSLHIVAWDRYAPQARLDSLMLWHFDASQPLFQGGAFSSGACGEICPERPSRAEWYADHDAPSADVCVFADVMVPITLPVIPSL